MGVFDFLKEIISQFSHISIQLQDQDSVVLTRVGGYKKRELWYRFDVLNGVLHDHSTHIFSVSMVALCLINDMVGGVGGQSNTSPPEEVKGGGKRSSLRRKVCFQEESVSQGGKLTCRAERKPWSPF